MMPSRGALVLVSAPLCILGSGIDSPKSSVAGNLIMIVRIKAPLGTWPCKIT